MLTPASRAPRRLATARQAVDKLHAPSLTHWHQDSTCLTIGRRPSRMRPPATRPICLESGRFRGTGGRRVEPCSRPALARSATPEPPTMRRRRPPTATRIACPPPAHTHQHSALPTASFEAQRRPLANCPPASRGRPRPARLRQRAIHVGRGATPAPNVDHHAVRAPRQPHAPAMCGRRPPTRAFRPPPARPLLVGNGRQPREVSRQGHGLQQWCAPGRVRCSDHGRLEDTKSAGSATDDARRRRGHALFLPQRPDRPNAAEPSGAPAPSCHSCAWASKAATAEAVLLAPCINAECRGLVGFREHNEGLCGPASPSGDPHAVPRVLATPRIAETQ